MEAKIPSPANEAALWAAICDILPRALELEAADRVAYLEAQCGDNLTLRRELEELVAASEKELWLDKTLFRNTEVRKPGSGEGTWVRLPENGRLGRYRLLEPLGQGAMGSIFRAEDEQLGRTAALKIIQTKDVGGVERERFAREAKAASALNHPNIVTIYEYGTDGDLDFIAMEYIPGVTVKAALEAGSIPLGQALEWAGQVSDALAAAHEAGIVHRDLKPSNLMVRPDGIVKVLDFGIAMRTSTGRGTTRVPGSELTLPGTILGTPSYMSPEQARGEALDCGTDIFSFGAILYELACGRKPFQGDDTLSVLHAVVNTSPPPPGLMNTAIPPQLSRLIQKCLEKDRADRWQDTAGLAKELSTIRDSEGVRSSYVANRKNGATGPAAIQEELLQETAFQETTGSGSADVGQVRTERALRIALELADLVIQAHEAGRMQRDISPRNLELSASGQIRLRDAERAMAAEYQAPEQISGARPTALSDVFSFGIVLSEMLTGGHPFRRENIASTTAAILEERPSLVRRHSDQAHGNGTGTGPGGALNEVSARRTPQAETLPQSVVLMLRRLLAKAAADRYPGMAEVRDDLNWLVSRMARVGEGTESGGRLRPVLGREPEYTELMARLRDARQGKGSVILMAGVAGIGKTHLAANFAAEARHGGFVTVTGRCSESRDSVPYVPFAEILDQLCRNSPPVGFLQAMGDVAPEIAGLSPQIHKTYDRIPAPLQVPADQSRRRLFGALRKFVEQFGHVSPMVVVVEDLHWADEATLQALTQVAAGVTNIPVIILATYREDEVEGNKALRDAVAALVQGKAVPLVLRSLSQRASRDLVNAIARQAPPPQVAQHIAALAEGNPFFVEELVQHLIEEGRLFAPGGELRTGAGLEGVGLPSSIRLTLRRRLERLSVPARRALTAAALMGRTFEQTLLEALDTAGSETGVALGEAVQAQLIMAAGPGVYSFRHELIRQTILEGLSTVQKEQNHARIVDALTTLEPERTSAAVFRQAHHCYEAGSFVDARRKAQALTLAGARAAEAAAWEDALIWYTRALQQSDAEGTAATEPLAAILAARAAVYRSLSMGEEAVADYERAILACEESGNTELAGKLSVALAWVHFWKLDTRAGLARIRRALRSIEPGTALCCRLQLLEALTLARGESAAIALEAFERALTTQRGLDDPALAAMAGQVETRLGMQIGNFHMAARGTIKAGPIFAAAGDTWNRIDSAYGTAAAGVFCGQPVEGEKIARAVLAEALAIGNQSTVWSCRKLIATGRMAAGDVDAAWSSMQEAHRITRKGMLAQLSHADDIGLGQLSFHRGEWARAIEYFTFAAQTERENFMIGPADPALFMVLAWTGSPEARAALPVALMRMPTQGKYHSLGEWQALTLALGGLAEIDAPDETAALWQATENMVETGTWWYTGTASVRSAAGIAATAAGEFTRAEMHHLTAIHQADNAPYRILQPNARYYYAKMLLARGTPEDRSQARSLLSEAKSLYATLGMESFSRRLADIVA